MMIKQIVTKVFTLIAAIYIGACSYLYFFQRSILYAPNKSLELPETYELGNASAIKLQTTDGIKITAWYIPAAEGKPTMLYFHGNAGNLGLRANKFKDFSNAGIGILAIEYRGFGDSEGSPSEEGLYNDARAALSHLQAQGFKTNNIILYGESLGTGVAVQMATENDFRAIFLEAPYDSITARAAKLYPYVPINLLLKDKFNSIDKIVKIHSPLIIFHGKDDKVMPLQHGKKLFDAANQPKSMYIFENVGHFHFNHNELAKLVLEYTQAVK